MDQQLDARVDSMFRVDCIWAWGFVAALWFAIGFVFLAIWPLADSTALRAVMVAGALALLAFNTAAIAAMVRHYREDKAFIYGLDIRHQQPGGHAAATTSTRQPGGQSS